MVYKARCFGIGTWLSLVEHLSGGQGVAGSNPAVPTTKHKSSEKATFSFVSKHL